MFAGATYTAGRVYSITMEGTNAICYKVIG